MRDWCASRTYRPDRRIALIAGVLDRHRDALEAKAVVTIRGDRVSISHPPSIGDG